MASRENEARSHALRANQHEAAGPGEMLSQPLAAQKQGIQSLRPGRLSCLKFLYRKHLQLLANEKRKR